MKIEYKKFEDAISYARGLKLRCKREWISVYNRNQLNRDGLPKCPNAVYKKEWKGWKDWLGSEFLSYSEAKNVAISLKLNEKRDWTKYIENKKPIGLPSNPNIFYKNNGWENWYTFLGKPMDARRYYVNDKFFKTWSSDMAYILGLWWSDGHIYENIFSISLQKSDKYLLENIVKVMESNYPVRQYENYAVFSIRSEEIVSDIKSLGGMERKSMVIDFPIIPSNYLAPFIRGLWDGDGCVSVNHRERKYSSSIVSGSEKLISRLRDILKLHIENCGGCLRKIKNSNCYELAFSKNDTIKLRNFMYGDNSKLMLYRKQEKFISIGDITFLQRKDMMGFSEAKSIAIVLAKRYNLKNSNSWKLFCKSGLRPKRMPSTPPRSYKNKGWISWYDFLGKEDSRKTKTL